MLLKVFKSILSFVIIFAMLFAGAIVPGDHSGFFNKIGIRTLAVSNEERAATPDRFPLSGDGLIYVYSYNELLMVGTGEQVRDTSGRAVKNENGENLVYASDADYCIPYDIHIPRFANYSLPDGFSGRFIDKSSDEKRLYDAESDTVYLNNGYQLAVTGMEDRSEQPLLTGDVSAKTFGTGNLIYMSEDSDEFVTYSTEHSYAVAAGFTYNTDILASEHNVDFDSAGALNTAPSPALAQGRDFPGQVVKQLDGKKYILIGNEEQLRKIGSNDAVWTPIYQVDLTLQGYVVDKDNQGRDIMLYGGDADLLQSQNEYKDFSFHVKDADGFGRYSRGVDQTTGQVMLSVAANSWDTGEKYSRTANYIIFRDIDLHNDPWTPIMFSGYMRGAKEDNGVIWNATEIVSDERPVISNLLINQTADIVVNEYIGVGFFATITNEVNVSDVGVSAGMVVVDNIEINNSSVTNTASKAANANSIVSALTSSLGWIVGGLVDGLGALLTIGNVQLTLRDTLSGLLNARAKDPTIFATGSFAGRVIGDVNIKRCMVTGNVSIQNSHNYTGGFIGYSEGTTEYSGLSQTLGGVVGILSSLLNVIPGLGLGDLITILLDNALPVGDLIPTGYKNPIIENCLVQGLTGYVGDVQYNYTGGFIGQQTGTRIHDSSVTNSSFSLRVGTYGGGFAGITRDAQIRGTLTDVGIELMRRMQPQSLLIGCEIRNSNINVSGGQDLGGFTGALCGSYCVNCGIYGQDINYIHVAATGSCAAGVAGIATVGWYVNLGKDEVNKATLLGTVRELLTGLLSSDTGKAQQLLSLTGIAPSIIEGIEADTGEITVSAGLNYAGGITGRGDGTYITESSEYYLQNFSYWQYEIVDYPTERDNDIKYMAEISCEGNFSGGIAGSLGTASITGLLNNTLGVGQFLGFTVSNTTVTGLDNRFDVSSGGNYAGGGFGETVGGTVGDTYVYELKSVLASNRAAGFTGCAGPGDLAGTGGLQLNLLGLDLLSLNNLLALGQGVAVEISDSVVSGIEEGFEVEATGETPLDSAVQYTAAGFVAKSNSTDILNSRVLNLKSVAAPATYGYAGGFVGTSETGGLADVADENSIKSLISANGLLNAVSYLIPKYTDCDTTFVNGGYVDGDFAGGFAADFESGTVENTSVNHPEPYSVFNIDKVYGRTYGGGFGGRIVSGALADAGKGLSILGGLTDVSINANGLLGLASAYVPYVKRAGVKSINGFTVEANTVRNGDLNSGSAGGFAGYMSGAQISYSDVFKLKHKNTTEPSDIDGPDGSAYYNCDYSVEAGAFGGGYAGKINIGSAASLGNGLKVLGSSIGLADVLSVLSVVVTTIEHSDVYGMPGGFSVLSTGTYGNSVVGSSGGFAGEDYGAHIQNSNSYNFSYIISENYAGGYVGRMTPGNVANILGQGDILSRLINVNQSLASLVEDFVPTIRNSETTCIPCGGAVRANSYSDASVQRGVAGGYAGYNEGGHIWGNNTNRWKDEAVYSGVTKICKALRIRSVWGAEYAGGYTGYMTSADTASTGNISLLGGLINANNILNALSFVYPTQEDTAVYGPLREMDMNTWNSWAVYVGKYGSMGRWVHTVLSQQELDNLINDYIYGMNVTAGRTSHVQQLISEGGDAGGYAGRMISGTITDSESYDVYKITAMRNTGGFAGRAETGGMADFGNMSILGLNLNLGSLLQALQVFVPVIKSSSVNGFKDGMVVKATGTDFIHKCGYAGGYIGSGYGVQIWGDKASSNGCNVTNLRFVNAQNAAGGYAGMITAASVGNVSTQASSGLLQQILNTVLNSPGDIASLAQATVSTIRKAEITADSQSFGFSVTGPAEFAGGFAGITEAAVIGSRKGNSEITVNDLNSVKGKEYAGGFIGLADVTGVAQVSGNGSNTSSLLSLVNLGQTDVLDAFRTYVYYSQVSGVPGGFKAEAVTSSGEALLSETRYTGCAGGFAGGVMNGTVEHSSVDNLSEVKGLNYTGGFAGHLGKNGVADIDSAQVSSLLGINAGVLDVFGSQVTDCTLNGIDRGYTVTSAGGEDAVAGGFCGYADISRIRNCEATNQKLVESEEISGGFVGKTSMKYLISAEADSPVVDLVLNVLNELVKLLYVVDLENIGLLNLNIPGLNNILGLKLLSDGDVLYVNLLGLRIGVSLVKSGDPNGTDTALITLGDSSIALPASENGIDMSQANVEIAINLIKGNRTKVVNSTVTGIGSGYDVFGGEADYEKNGVRAEGFAGGFVGYNDEGLFEENEMFLCDIIRGTPEKIGIFSGYTRLKSVYQSNTIDSIEGNGNFYNVYRRNEGHTGIKTEDAVAVQATKSTGTHAGRNYEIFEIQHYVQPVRTYSNWENAVLTGQSEDVPINVYVSNAKAVLMQDTRKDYSNVNLANEPSVSKDPCIDRLDFTVEKVWDDWENRDTARPDNIHIQIFRTGYDKNGNIIVPRTQVTDLQDAEQNGEIIMSVAVDSTERKELWKRVFYNIPASEVLSGQSSGQETVVYYTYEVEETPVDGYSTSIAYDNETTAIITNIHRPTLPVTGGFGDIMFVAAGTLSLVFIYIFNLRKKKERTGRLMLCESGTNFYV